MDNSNTLRKRINYIDKINNKLKCMDEIKKKVTNHY